MIDVRRSRDRSETNLSWLRGRHSFWVGGQPYDPDNTHHGLLLVHNEDVIRPGTGFETHPHRDMEIVTWVLHSEKNDSWRLGGEPHTNPMHLIQMWVVPDESGVTPGYEQPPGFHTLTGDSGCVAQASSHARAVISAGPTGTFSVACHSCPRSWAGRVVNGGLDPGPSAVR
jgi:quercetin 2,3-dioxygenase